MQKFGNMLRRDISSLTLTSWATLPCRVGSRLPLNWHMNGKRSYVAESFCQTTRKSCYLGLPQLSGYHQSHEYRGMERTERVWPFLLLSHPVGHCRSVPRVTENGRPLFRPPAWYSCHVGGFWNVFPFPGEMFCLHLCVCLGSLFYWNYLRSLILVCRGLCYRHAITGEELLGFQVSRLFCYRLPLMLNSRAFRGSLTSAIAYLLC